MAGRVFPAKRATELIDPPLPAVAIIPAFNEGPRIAGIVTVARESGEFTRVVVVDDGSTDDTATAAESAGAEVFRYEHNLGKGYAMHIGALKTKEPVICFLDADLLYVTKDHLARLVRPVTTGQVRTTLAKFTGGRLATTLAQWICPLISGQRCIRRDDFTGFTDWDCRFQIEVQLNKYVKRKGLSVEVVPWRGASHVMKEEKRGLFRGAWARAGMFWDITRAKFHSFLWWD